MSPTIAWSELNAVSHNVGTALRNSTSATAAPKHSHNSRERESLDESCRRPSYDAASPRGGRHAGSRLPFDAVVNRGLRRVSYGPAAARVITEPVNDHLVPGCAEGQWRNNAASARSACDPDLIPSLSRRSQVAANPHACHPAATSVGTDGSRAAAGERGRCAVGVAGERRNEIAFAGGLSGGAADSSQAIGIARCPTDRGCRSDRQRRCLVDRPSPEDAIYPAYRRRRSGRVRLSPIACRGRTGAAAAPLNGISVERSEPRALLGP